MSVLLFVQRVIKRQSQPAKVLYQIRKTQLGKKGNVKTQ